MASTISSAHSNAFLTLTVLCALTTMAVPINTGKDAASEEILRNLKKGLLSTDSVLVSIMDNKLAINQ